MIRVLWFWVLLTPLVLHAENRLQLEQAERLAQLPLDCIQTEYPNKLGQVLGSVEHLGEPRALHPAFFGCFDWHSSVHGHWSLVRLLRSFPGLPQAETARRLLSENINPENIRVEIHYFQRDTETSYERTYGWAWLLKLAEELRAWDDPLATDLLNALQPLVDLIAQRYIEYYPKLVYPIRVGEHTNSAFGASFAWDYAVAVGHTALRDSLSAMARRFFLEDRMCPIRWEPSGYDFLSPCLEEIDLMRRVLPREEFLAWLSEFMPDLFDTEFSLEPGRVIDRTDGKLVHLDGLNFSRAWVLYGLASQYPELQHLESLANEHVAHSLPNLVGDSYEGGHWLGSFAIYALGEAAGLIRNELPALPEAVSNNAVAEITVDGVQYLTSFMGLGAGKTQADISRKAWLWRSDSRQWEAFPEVPVNEGRLASIAVGVFDRILLLGGYSVAEDGHEISTPEVFLVDPVKRSYQRRADMPLPVDDTVAAFYANRYVYLVSGWHDEGNVTDVQLYDTWEDRWSQATAFPGVPVFGHAGGIVNGELIIVGGVGVLGEKDGKRQFGAIDQAWKGTIDPEDPTRIDWQELPTHTGTDRYRMAASGVADRGLVVFAGGTGRPYNFNGIGYDGQPAEPVGDVFAWDSAQGRWVDFPALGRVPTMDHRGLLQLNDGRFVTLGGMRGGQTVIPDVVAFQIETQPGNGVDDPGNDP